MSYSAKDRDRGRATVTAMTAAVTVGSLTSMGWLAGAAADEHNESQAQAEETQRPASGVRIVVRERPTRTRFTVRYVETAGVTTLGGGSIAPATTAASSALTGSGGSSGPSSGGGGSPGPSAPAPQPPPTSSGS